MKNMKRLFLLTPLLLCLLYCNKDDDNCNISRNTLDNLIVEELSIECFPEDENQTNFIIQSEAEFQNTFQILSTCILPVVDFDQFTLLGIRSGASGCSRAYQTYVKKEGDDFSYILRVKECGGCEPWVVQIHWVTVPKIPEIANVSFTVERL